MIDSHAHLGLCEPPDEELVGAARRLGVTRILTVGLDEVTNGAALAAAEAHEGVFAGVGRHPNSAAGFDDAAAEAIEELARHERVAAVGETGLDLYREQAPIADQRRAFSAQIAIAVRVGKPVVVHLRDRGGGEAADEAFATLAAEADGATVILHCFSGDARRAAVAAENGWYCSFAGNVTYGKSDALREAARVVPEELLLAETDSPFLAPQSVRGRPNEPANVVEVGERLAEERGVPYAELERALEANAARAFGW